MARTDFPRVAIIGAGPVGLEAALYAASLKLPFTVYERGRVGEHLQQWGHVKLFSPFGMNVTPLGVACLRAEVLQHTFPGDNDCISGREHLAAYLEPLARSPLLRERIRTETAVLHVGRRGYLKEDGVGDPKRGQQPFHLLLRSAKGAESVEEADIVFDCTGTYGQHRWMGESGIPAIGERAAEPHVAYGLEDVLGGKRAAYQDRTILVVGGGYSAATTVCDLAALAQKHQSTWVIWLARGAGTQPIKRIANDPLRERDLLAVRANTFATRSDGNVEFHGNTTIDAIETAGPDRGFKVRGRVAGKAMSWDAERVIANVGFSPDRGLYRELQVHECYASFGPMNLAAALLKHGGGDCLTMPSLGAAVLRTPEPNFYILGAKSYGRNSNFLMRTGFEQVREVFRDIVANAELKLRFPALGQIKKVP
jgi:thioredoxin reductase